MTDVGAQIIRVERRIEARPEVVYSYLTDSIKWARWQGATAEIDARVGGTFRVTMGNGQVAEGRFVELVPDRRVRFTWGWHGGPSVPPGSSTVEIELAEDHGATRLTLTHRGLPPEDIPIHEMGWQHYLPRLTTVAEGGDPGPDPSP